jgi:hypothetical protein
MAAARLRRHRPRAEGELVRVEVVDTRRALRDGFDEGKLADRRAFLERALGAGGVLVVGGFLIAGLPKLAASAASPEQDVKVANFALLFEYLQAAFYEEASAQEGLDEELSEFVAAVREHERAHVDLLKGFLGTAADPEPSFQFEDVFSDSGTVAATAVTLEDLGVSAYNGQATNLTPDALAAAASIVSVDARHAAWIRAIVGKQPAPDPTDTPKSQAEVLESLQTAGFVQVS